MGTDVTVLRVFTDPAGNFGNPLGVVDASTVAPVDRQDLATELGYSETIFVDLPAEDSATAHAQIFTPATELPFAGHPTIGAAWWLRSQGHPVHTLQLQAGIVAVSYDAGAAEDLTTINARSEWAPEFAIHDLDSADAVLAADPDDYSDDVAHYLWAWTDRTTGAIRSRMFAANLGVAEDEATGSAAVRMTEYLSEDLRITQGHGSLIETHWSPEGWVQVAGRVVNDGVSTVA